MAVATAPRPASRAKPGRVYRGKSGMWSFILHRATGLGILGFLFLHILGESFMGVSPDAYDTIAVIYHNFFFRVSEVGLLFALLYHAANGLRITLVDFFPSLTAKHRPLLVVQGFVIAALFIPSSVMMILYYFQD